LPREGDVDLEDSFESALAGLADTPKGGLEQVEALGFRVVRERALADSGCTGMDGVISLDVVEEMGALGLVRARSGELKGMRDDWSSRRRGVLSLWVWCGSNKSRVELEVLDGVEDRVILGLRVWARFGWSVTGMEHRWPDGVPGRKEREEAALAGRELEERPEAWAVEDRIDEEEFAKLQSAVAGLLAENSAIDPSTPACRGIPEATMRIPLRRGAVTYRPQYPLAAAVRPAVEEKIAEDLRKQYIMEAPQGVGLEHNSPVITVGKKDVFGNKTKLRVCGDSRALNAAWDEEEEKVPEQIIPRVADVLASMAGFRYASSLDLTEAYHQLPIAREDWGKTAFRWGGKRYVWKRWFFGLKPNTGRFQRVMEKVLDGIDGVIIFVDDLLVLTKSDSLEEHIATVCEVLRRLNAHGLRLNAQKCRFGYRKVLILGHHVAGDERSVDPIKLLTALEWPQPTTGKGVERFLGFMNYVRDYVPNYAAISAPLEALKSRKTFVMNAIEQNSFETLVGALEAAPVLSTYDPELPLLVSTDASKHGLGAVLYQQPEGGGAAKFLQFASKSLVPGQKNYGAGKRECLGVVFALRAFHLFLRGRKFTLFTDHDPLTSLFTKHQLAAPFADWLDVLLEYDFDIVHRPGVDMVMPDALSRMMQKTQRMRQSDALVRNHVADGTGGRVRRVCAMEARARVRLGKLLRQQDEMPSRPEQELDEFVEERFLKQLVEDVEEKKEMLRDEHAAGHLGAENLFKRIWENGFWWPGLRKECNSAVALCKPCLKWNIARNGFRPLKSLRADMPWDHVAMDLLHMPKSSSGNVAVLILVDVTSRYVVTKPLKDCTMESVAEALLEVLWVFGPMKVVQSDNGPEFVNGVLEKLMEKAGVEHRFVAAWNPRANGLAERFVRTVKKLIYKKLEGRVNDWDEELGPATFAVNKKDARNSSTAAFTLFFARKANGFADFSMAEMLEEAEAEGEAGGAAALAELEELRKLMEEEVLPAVAAKAMEKQDKLNAGIDKKNKRAKKPVEFKVGDLVMLRVPDLVRPAGVPPFTGPYVVDGKSRRGGTFMLKDLLGKRVHRRGGVPGHQLKFVASTGEETELVDANGEVVPVGAERGVVKEILQHKKEDGENLFLTRWKEWPEEEDTWLRAADFDESTLLTAYWKKQLPKNRRKKKGKAAEK
jgi:transposase InsO family protein